MTSAQLIVAMASAPGVALIWAGALKLWRPAPAAAALVRFRLTQRVRLPFGRLAGAIEFGAGIGLAAFPLRPIAYLAPLALLSLFSFLIARAVAARDTFSCACFGSRNEAISWWTLARTAALLIAAALALTLVIVSHPAALAGAQAFRVSSSVALVLSLGLLAAALRSTTPFAD